MKIPRRLLGVAVMLVSTPALFSADESAAPPTRATELFDGRTLAGWTFVTKDPAADAAAIWSVRDGVIRCAGKPNGYARTVARWRDYALHAEWRWPEAAGNSGVFLHVSGEDKVWPACLEVQLKATDAGSIRANGGTRVAELVPGAKDPINVTHRAAASEKPAGEWNACDVVCRGDTITVTINGVRQNHVTAASVTSGAIALQAEGAPVEFRNLVVRPLPSLADAQPPLSSYQRILFLGDSITYGGGYVVEFERWLAAQPGAARTEVFNLGLSSETVSGLSEPGHAGGKFPRPDLHERLARVLAAVRPQLVFACYGMNDGIYQPLDEERFWRFRTGMERLHDAATAAGARLIHLTPPVYDPPETNKDYRDYDQVLARYAEWLLAQREHGWEVIDIHGPMRVQLDARRRTEPGFRFAKDGVHPGAEGHALMAAQAIGYFAPGASPPADDAARVALFHQRMELLRNAWLSETKHTRPGVPAGLPLGEAQRRAAELTRQLQPGAK